MDDTAMALVVAVPSLSPQEDDADREGPLSVIYSFLFFQFLNPAGLGNCFRPLINFKNSGKIHRAFIYYVEPVVKFAFHLENILCGNTSEIGPLAF